MPIVNDKTKQDQHRPKSSRPPIIHLLREVGFDNLTSDSSTTLIEATLRRLAARIKGEDKLTYQLVREEAIPLLKAIGISSPAQLIDAAFGSNGAENSTQQEGGLTLTEPQPWADPVDGADLLNELVASFRRFLVLPDWAAEALALWVLHTHSFDAAYSTPYVNINSPVKGCGKTTNLEILGHLVAKPLFSSNITAPAVFRTVEKYQPTLLIDEADTFVGLNDELRGVLNSGNRKNTAFTIRLVGENYEPKRFSTWCPKVFALIGHLPDTLEDRSIGVTMHRKTREEWVEEFNPNKITPELDMLRRKASRWAKDHLDALREADPPIPEELHNRTRDKWRPLLQIAEVAGGEWPELARKAALSLSAGANDEENSTGIKLLADIRALFDSKRSEVLSSKELVEALYEMEDRPWPDWKNDFGISKAQVARLLAPFGIRPKQLWISGQKIRGYERADFEDAFSRYLPSSETVEPVGPSDGKGLSMVSGPVGTQSPTALKNDRNPHWPGVLPDLPDERGARTIKGGRDD